MARKTITYKVTDEGRDKGKTFLITEMSASRCESWATRLLLAFMALNPDIPEDFADMGTAALAKLGLQSLGALKFETAEPLLAEMMTCIEFMPRAHEPQFTRALIEEDIEEVATRMKMKVEVWQLHMDFLSAVAPSILGQKEAPAAPLHVTRTSPRQSRS